MATLTAVQVTRVKNGQALTKFSPPLYENDFVLRDFTRLLSRFKSPETVANQTSAIARPQSAIQFEEQSFSRRR